MYAREQVQLRMSELESDYILLTYLVLDRRVRARASAAAHLGAGVCLPPCHHRLVPQDAGVALSQKPRRGRDVARPDVGAGEVWLTSPQIREPGAAGVERVCVYRV